MVPSEIKKSLVIGLVSYKVNKIWDCSFQKNFWAVVEAQLAEWSFLIPEVRGSNPVISEIFLMNIFTVEKNESKEKRGREWPN